MKTIKVFLITTLFTTNLFSQSNFEEGFFIDNNGVKINCLINDLDWQNTPQTFEYKESVNDINTKKLTHNDFRELEIIGKYKYLRKKVNIDRSGNNLNNLSNKRAPEWSMEDLVLKVLLEGEASLFEYKNELYEKYFYSIDTIQFEQLVFKRFFNNNGDVGKNNYYQQQLWLHINYSKSSIESFNQVKYSKKSLLKTFTNFNELSGKPYQNYNYRKKRELVKFRINPGITFSDITYNDLGKTTNFESNTNFRFGFESELILPFNNGKWSIPIEPNFNFYNGNETTNNFNSMSINYSCFEVPIGLRYYYYSKNEFKTYINAFITHPFLVSDYGSINFEYSDPFSVKSSLSAAFGMGVDFKRFHVEVRYNSKKDIISQYVNYANYKRLSIIIGYQIAQIIK